jgi:maleylacetate reductase
MIAVPTTLSAAEFNPFAGISDPRHGIKESFGHRLIVPRVIVLDPAATLATPMDLMLPTGIKAVDHAVERLCSHQAHPFVLGTATEALRLLTRALPAHKAKPDDMSTRLDLQFGMWLSIGAGTSGVGTGASHGIGHVLGAACHVPHGHTSCVMLPSVLRWNLSANAERQKRVSEAFGKPDVPAADLVANLVKSLGLPTRLADVGVGKDRFREIAEKSMHDRAVLNNPRPIKAPAEVMEILELAA